MAESAFNSMLLDQSQLAISGHDVIDDSAQPSLVAIGSPTRTIAIEATSHTDVQPTATMPIEGSETEAGLLFASKVAGANPEQNAVIDSSKSLGHHRLETLIEQQNELLLKQLQISEKHHESQARAACHFHTHQDILKSLHPEVKELFEQWRKQFRANARLYVAQSKKYAKIQAASANGELVQPFSGDASRTWDWPPYYRLTAQPLQGDLVNQVAEASGAEGSEQDSTAGRASIAFDVDQAFGELRCKHAWELQNFVLGHQKACMDSLIWDLALDRQTQKLQVQIADFAESQGGFSSETQQMLEHQAKTFAEAVHRVEMQAAEKKITEKCTCPVIVLQGMRIMLILVLLAAFATVSHEQLMRIFAVFFSLGCGMALLWEDVLVMSVRFLLGQSLKRLEHLRGCVSEVDVNLPIIFWQ